MELSAVVVPGVESQALRSVSGVVRFQPGKSFAILRVSVLSLRVRTEVSHPAMAKPVCGGASQRPAQNKKGVAPKTGTRSQFSKQLSGSLQRSKEHAEKADESPRRSGWGSRCGNDHARQEGVGNDFKNYRAVFLCCFVLSLSKGGSLTHFASVEN